MKLSSNVTLSLLSAVLLPVFPSSTFADNRPFTYVYEATTAPKGMIEYEQWITWKARRGDPGNLNQWDFRHELEFGITDRLQLGLYLSNWKVINEKGSTRGLWNSASVEAIYNLSNPTTDWLGSAIYGEVSVGDELVELETKLIFQKNLGNWILAYNATLEAEWEGSGLNERTGEFKGSLGASYQLSPRWSIGAELLHEVEFPDWSSAGDHALYIGPNASFRFKGGFATATMLIQTTGINEEPDVQTRLIFGFHF